MVLRNVLAVLLALVSGPVAACIWDSDTLTDELRTHASLFEIITGQFPEHGRAYYEQRAKRSLESLARDPDDLAARTDLAVSYLQLGKLDEAQLELERLEAASPGRYETLSNLGVLHQRRGEYGRAAELIAKALSLNPAGHPGVGDYYLKMLRHRANGDRDAADRNLPPQTDFLGGPYSEGPYSNREDVDHNRLVALIRADRTFADAYLVLGDTLRRSWDLNLALWSYLRALQLGHPNPEAVNSRIDEVFRHWDQAIGWARRPRILEGRPETVKAIEKDLQTASGWVRRFQEVEAQLLAASLASDPRAVEAEMARRGITKLSPESHGVRESISGLLTHPGQAFRFLLPVALPVAWSGAVGLLVLLWLRSLIRRKRFGAKRPLRESFRS